MGCGSSKKTKTDASDDGNAQDSTQAEPPTKSNTIESKSINNDNVEAAAQGDSELNTDTNAEKPSFARAPTIIITAPDELPAVPSAPPVTGEDENASEMPPEEIPKNDPNEDI